ncbi:hypothetical protein HED51_22390 [Ochrobactrum grignonense]|nr:hypothetical protein [Brucella grignonensis]
MRLEHDHDADFDPDTLRQKAKEFLLSRAHRKSDAMPCSEGQRSLWYLHQMAPESAAYNVGYAIEIEGPIDHKIIRKCCRDIVKRHAELQSVFSSTSGSLLKRIEVGERLDFKQIPVGIVSDREIRDIVIKEYKRPFDLSCGPLIRFVAFDLKNGNHIFLLVAHHIVCDGDSFGCYLTNLEINTPKQLVGR